MLSATSILSGTAFEDVDGNGQRDPGESVLESVTVYLDQNDNGVLDRLGLEPDQFEAGQTIGDQLAEATVWTTFRGDLAALAESADTSITSTGSRAFANQFGDVAFSDAAYRLEIDVTNTVNTLSIDFTAIDANAIGRLEVRDSNFNVLGTFTTSPLTTGQSETMTISVPGIAYAIASSTDALTGTLDNLTLGDGNETTVITDASGQYAFTDLAEGDYVIREVAPAGYEQSYPQASASRLFAIDPNLTHSARIVEIDPSDGTTIRAFDAPGNGTSSTAGLAFDGSTLFFVDSTEDTLYELDPNTGAVLDSMSLSTTPRWDGVAVLDGLVYVNDPTSNLLLVIDPATNSVVNTVNIPASNYEPFGGLGELPDPSGGKLIGPVGSSNVVALLDPVTGAMTSSFSHAVVSDGDNFGATSIDGLIYLGFNDAAGTVQVYQPDGTLVRSFQTGFDMSGLGAANSIDGAHRVSVAAGATLSGLDFGNVRQTGSISGTKFEDLDGNGQRGAGEGPVAGVTIYLDTNNNSVLDVSEQSTQTAADGTYQFTNLLFGDYVVREVVSSDFIQTTPATRDAFFYAVAGAANELITIDAATGEVEHIGLFGTDMNGLVHTRSGELFGLQGTGTDSFYSIDTTTGAATPIGPTGDVVFGLAYNEATDTIYTIRNLGTTRHLAAIDRATGATTVIGPGSADVVNVSGIAFDVASNQVIAFDNLDDEFWGFDVETGVVTLLSDTSNFAAYGFTPVGNDFVMSTTQGNLIQIDPFMATVTPYLTMSEILGIDALDYVPASDGAHHVTVQAGQVHDQLDFGNQRRGLELSIDDSTINENGGTTTATVTRNTDTAEDLLVYLSSGDSSEVTVPATVTIPAGQTSARFVVSGMDDVILDGTQTVSISASMSATNSTNYSDSFSGSELSSFWEAFTDIPGASVTQIDGVLRVESPTAPSSFSDAGVRSQITTGDSSFTAKVDFRIPLGGAMSWLSGSAGSNQTYGVYHYPPENSYRIWIDNPGFTGSDFGRNEFGDESTNWHQLSLRYDAATHTVQSFVDGSQVNSEIVDLSGGHISLHLKDRSSLGSGPTVVEFDNFSLTYASAVGVATASVTVLDDEVAGVQITSTGPIVVDESGSTATFNVNLLAAPLTPVVATVTSADTSEVTVSPMTLTFTSADWNVSQTVTITGIDDLFVDGNQLTDITVAVDPAVSDDAFDSTADQSVSVQTNDNDVAQVLVSPTSIVTQENGASQTFQVGINAVPTSDVTITIQSTNTREGTIDVSEVIFTPDNFSPVTVTVTPVDDLLAGSLDGDIVYSIITSSVVSADSRFNGLDPADVTVTNEDNDTPVNLPVTATAGRLITGTESGSFADTATDDSRYQVLTESAVGVTGGKKPKQGSALEYHWTFTGLESANEFYVDAYRDPNSDGDDFSFEYSVDGGASWNSLVTISSASPGNTASVTGLSVSGDVLVRVVDTDRSPVNGRDTPSLQSVYVDQLYFRMFQEDLRPAVIISAIDNAADENPSTPGVVRIERAEATTEPLVVQYLVSGNATSGEDYAALTGTASIAANQTYVDVVITPLDDAVEEGAESVTLTLVDAVHYRVLGNHSASVTIADDDLQVFTATGESGSGGTVTGDFTWTHDDDDIAQTITERESGGRKSDRHTFLEHTWQFNVSGAKSLYLDAATEATVDDFVFAWSIDGVNFTELATIGTGSSAIGPAISQMFAVPDLSGTVYVRVTDTNRTAGERVEESLTVDQLFFSTLPVLDFSSQSDPNYDLSFSATSVTDEDETLTHLDRVFEELARSSKRY